MHYHFIFVKILDDQLINTHFKLLISIKLLF